MFTNMARPGCQDDKSREPGWDQAWPREEGSMTSRLSAAHPDPLHRGRWGLEEGHWRGTQGKEAQ